MFTKKGILMFVAALMIITSSLIISAVAAQNDDIKVNPIEAEKAAAFFVARFGQTLPNVLPEWSIGKIVEPVTYYSIDKQIAAYEFTVTSYDKAVGFIIISGSKDRGPVLEWGAGRAPSSFFLEAKRSAIDKGLIGQDYDSKCEILYWGALTYSTQFGEIMFNSRTAINLTTGMICKIPDQQLSPRQNSAEAQELWGKLDTFDPKTTLTVTDTISGVPAWYQKSYSDANCDSGDDIYAEYPDCVGPVADYWDYWDGCAPIVGAMVLGYWDGHGYSNIANTDESVIDECHVQMNTTDEGATISTDIPIGIEDASAIYGYSFDAWNIVPDWSDVVDEVQADKPFVLIFVDQEIYGDHAVTGVGYYEDGYGFTAYGIHDTYDTSIHWIDSEASASTYMTIVHP